MSFSKDAIPEFLNYVLSIVELVIVLIIACLTGFAVYCFLSGSGQQTRFISLMEAIEKNWKAALILLIPLFYRPVRTFLEQLEKAWGLERRKPASIEKEQNENP